jgi:predicted nucleic acid-binding protein
LAGVIVLDASALIAHLDSHDAHHKRVQELLREQVGEPIAASVITLAEVLVIPARAGRLDQAQTVLAELGVASIALDATVPRSLAALRAETGLRLPDCCVLHAAALTDAHSVVTFDERLARAAAARHLHTP